MKYNRAEKRAKVLNLLTHNDRISYEVRTYKNDDNDAFVVQLYNNQYAGVAAY